MMTWLRTFGAWLWKEWRDHRAVVVGILIAIPALTALAFWAFGDHLATVYLHATRAVFLGIALGLVNFAIAASLFAGETRRGTMRTVRRLPRAVGSAFAAKVTFLALVVVLVTAWQGMCLAIAEAGNGGIGTDFGYRQGADVGAIRAMAIWDDLGAFPASAWWLNGLGYGVVCLWTLLVSTWLGRSGVAGVGALVVLAALGTPFFLFFLAHPYFFPGPMALVGWTAGLSAAVALVASAVSFLWGGRFEGRVLRPFLLGGAVLLVALGGGYAYAHVALADWLDIDPRDENFTIYDAHVGAGERYLFVSVHRGDAWVGDSNLSAREHATWTGKRGTPLQAWVMDLETGALRKYRGDIGRYFMEVSECMSVGPYRSYEPAPALVCYDLGVDKSAMAVTWWDTVAGEPRRTLPPRVRDAVSLDLVRKTLSACSWQRDAEGRRVWLRDNQVEREGQTFPEVEGVVARVERERFLWPVPGGWYGWRKAKGTVRNPNVFVDIDTGREWAVTTDYRLSGYGNNVMSPDYTWGYLNPQKPMGRKLIPLRGGPAIAPKGELEGLSSIVGRNLVLAMRGPKSGARTVHVWNPASGDEFAIRWDGPGPEGLANASLYGWGGDGRVLLMLASVSPTRTAWAVLSPDLRTARLLSGWARWSNHKRPVALLRDDSVVIAERKQVVRYAPGGEVEVLFPR